MSDSNIGTDTWKQIGQNIMSITVEANSDAFGWSVSISDDGMIAVGAPNSGINGKGSGHVRIYLLDDNRINWKQIGGDIDGDMSGDRLGHSVSLAANGTIVVIGAPHAHVNEKIRSGEVKVYQLDSAGSNWERLGKSIFGENDSDMFGWSVDISSDGNTIAIGSRGYNSSTGSVQVFYLEVSDKGDRQWKPIGQNITGDAKGDKFGSCVSLSDDGKTLAVGAPLHNGRNMENSGHVSVYQMDDSKED